MRERHAQISPHDVGPPCTQRHPNPSSFLRRLGKNPVAPFDERQMKLIRCSRSTANPDSLPHGGDFMKSPTIGLVTFLLVIGAFPSATAQTSPLNANPSGPPASATQRIDHGPLAVESPAAPISVTIALSLSNLNDAENLLQSMYTPGNVAYHQFLSADQFVSRYAPSDA